MNRLPPPAFEAGHAGGKGASYAHKMPLSPSNALIATLTPEDRTSGWVGRLRVVGGQGAFSLGGEASAEEQLGQAAIAFRVSLRMGM